MKKIALFICCLSILNSILSQRLALRPYIGIKRFWVSKRNSNTNNFDPTFSSKDALNNHSVGIALEYSRKAITYEFCFTAQASLFNFSSYHKDAGIGVQYT